jgi:hypothetical protein
MRCFDSICHVEYWYWILPIHVYWIESYMNKKWSNINILHLTYPHIVLSCSNCSIILCSVSPFSFTKTLYTLKRAFMTFTNRNTSTHLLFTAVLCLRQTLQHYYYNILAINFTINFVHFYEYVSFHYILECSNVQWSPFHLCALSYCSN